MEQLTSAVARLPTSSKPSDLGYRSTYSSLYHTLQPGHIVMLDEAILAYTLGHFDDAETIFQRHLPPSHTLPILVLERSKAYDMQGLHREKIDLFRKALEWNKDGVEQAPERRLILLLLRHAEALVYGTLHIALEEARRMPDFLAELPLDEFTDIHVRLTFTAVQPN